MHILSVLFSSLLFIQAVGAFNQEPVDHRLLTINEEEKESLELLFETWVQKDQFGYALISEKPMALGGGFVKAPCENILCGYDQSFLFWRGWELWKEHFGKVKFPRFLLIEENFAAAPNIRFVFLINKPLFIETMRVYAERCRELTGRLIDPVQLLEDLEEGTITLQQAIGFNEEILGIFLGFGQHNAALYARRQQISGPLLIPLALDQRPSEGYSSVDEEVKHIWKRLEASFNEPLEPFMIDSVRFVADRSAAETVILCQKYRKAQTRLTKMYREQSYLEVSLRLLLAPGEE